MEGTNNNLETQTSIINIDEWNHQEINKKDYYGIHNHLLSEVCVSSKTLLKNHHLFSKQIKNRNKISNQESSGRCWIFAGVNVIRNKFIFDNNLKNDFEYSQSYLLFWDKFERVNYYTNLYSKLHNEDEKLDSRLMQHLLKDPLEDGGQWQMLVNLIDKYGLVPKSVFPETKHSSNTRGLNMVLTKKLRDYCKQIRENNFNKEKSLQEIYTLLVKFLGKPPSKFDWEYKDKSDKYNRVNNLTPISFYQKSGVDLTQYVSIVNDPRVEYNNNYGVNYLNNVEGGKEVKYLNLEMKHIKDLVKKSIDNDQPVWFGSDVGKFLHSKSNILDKNVFNIEELLDINFELNKKERIDFGDSLMTHAMAITGYNTDSFGNIDRWEIENSWGSSGMNEGYYSMSDEWMDQFVYQIIVNIKFLNSENKNLWNKEIISRHPPWDPMGSLA